MKKLLILIALFPVMLFAQSNNDLSFKISKNSNKDSAVSSYSPFQYSFCFYRNITSLIHRGKDPSQEINGFFGFNIELPIELAIKGNKALLCSVATGLYDNLTVHSRDNLSAPAEFGIHLMMAKNQISISAGPRFFLPGNDPLLSGNILFEWGGGYSRYFRIGRHLLGLAINYKRLVNENFIELRTRFVM